MTISTTASNVTLQGNGVTTAWPFAFRVPGATLIDQTFLQVTVVDTTVSPPTTTIIANGNYSVTGISTPAVPSNAGTVTYPLVGPALIAGQYLTISRVLTYVQGTSIPNQSNFYGNVVEAALDYLTMLVQQNNANTLFSFRVSSSDPGGAPAVVPIASVRANNAAVWDAAGNLVGGGVAFPPAVVTSPLYIPRVNAGGTAYELRSPAQTLADIAAQPLDADLTAYAALATAGLVARTGAGAVATRSLTQPAAGIAITQSDGVAGNPTFALADDLAALEGLGSTGIAVRTAANTWAQRTTVAPAAGITIANPAGVAGDLTFALANDLAALEGLGSTGIAVRTAADTWAQRTVTGTAAEITATNGNGVAGDPTLSLPAALTFTGKTVTGGTFAGGTITGATINATSTLDSSVIGGVTPAAITGTTIVGNTSVKASNTRSLTMTGAASGNVTLRSDGAGPIWIAGTTTSGNVRLVGSTGSDGLEISKQSSDIYFDNMNSANIVFRAGSSRHLLDLIDAASAINNHQMTVAAAGSYPVLAVAGGDTNINFGITWKGTATIVTGAALPTSSAGLPANALYKTAGVVNQV